MDFIYYYWGIAGFLIELLSAASAYSVLVPLLAKARAKGETEAQQCVQSIFSHYIMTMPVALLSPRCHFLGNFPTFFSKCRTRADYHNRYCVWFPLLLNYCISPLDAQGDIRHLPSISTPSHCTRTPCCHRHRNDLPVANRL